MDFDELENGISDLEEAYSAVEDVVNVYRQYFNESSNDLVLNQILDGIQYFINKLSLEKQKVEIQLEEQWDNR